MKSRKSCLFCVMLALLVTVTAMGQTGRADYRVVPLPDRIDGVKSADFVLNSDCLINYPTGNRDMERNATMLSGYIEEMTGHLQIQSNS